MSVWWDAGAGRYRSTLAHKVLYVWCWPVIRAAMHALPPETAQHLAIHGIRLAARVDQAWSWLVAIAVLAAIRLLIVLPWFTCEPARGRKIMNTDADIVTALVDGISRLLAGHDPATQGVALADCVATWLAGHHVAGDEDATQLLRADILAHHCATVAQLVPLAEVIGTTP